MTQESPYDNPAWQEASRIQPQRESECMNSPTGHLMPNEKTKYCDYCKMKIEYVSRYERKNIFGKRIGPRFVDGTGIKRRKHEDIENQKKLDRFTGITKIIQDLGL